MEWSAIFKSLYIFAIVVALLVVAYRMGRIAGHNDAVRAMKGKS